MARVRIFTGRTVPSWTELQSEGLDVSVFNAGAGPSGIVVATKSAAGDPRSAARVESQAMEEEVGPNDGNDEEESDEEEEEDEEYEVEKVVACKLRDGSRVFQVKWKGFDEADNSWEPLDNLTNSLEIVKEFIKEAEPAKPTGKEKRLLASERRELIRGDTSVVKVVAASYGEDNEIEDVFVEFTGKRVCCISKEELWKMSPANKEKVIEDLEWMDKECKRKLEGGVKPQTQ